MPSPTPVAVKLKLPQKLGRIHPTFHVSLIRLYRVNPDEVPPEPTWVKGDPWYEVEKIMSHRTKGRGPRARLYFKIRWAGYSSFHDSWEPDTGGENRSRNQAPRRLRRKTRQEGGGRRQEEDANQDPKFPGHMNSQKRSYYNACAEYSMIVLS